MIDQILAIETAKGQVLWGLGDNLGTIRLVVNSAGEVQNRIVYDSFGEVVSESNPEVDFRYGFTGRELDPETGLVYYRARYYDGERFISEDPIGFGAGDGNLYRYVGNSPTIFVDPSGNISLYDALNAADQFASGLASAATGGLTDKIRESLYGDTATRNHSGGFRTAGELFGTGSSIIIGGGGAGWVKAVNGVLDAAGTISDLIDIYESGRDIFTGCGDLDDFVTLGVGGAGLGAGGLPPLKGGGLSNPDSNPTGLPFENPFKKGGPPRRADNSNFIRDPQAQGPHTTLGIRKGRKGSYTQGATFDKHGNFRGITDVTDHGRPSNHGSPHWHHALGPNSIEHGPHPIPNFSDDPGFRL